MILKTKSVATRLLLLSCVSAVVVVVAIVAFIKLSMIPQLTNKSLENQTRSLAHALKGVYGKPEQWNKAVLAEERLLDAFSQENMTVATLFLFEGGRYVRVATTLKKGDGSRALGTALDPDSEAALALASGREFFGNITLFNRLHMATYLPVSFSDGTRGAVFVGIDYSSADPMLALAGQMDYMVIGVGLVGVLLLALGMAVSIRVEQAHRETEDIFRTTQDGLFLLDHALRIGSQTSRAVARVLGSEAKPGDNFLELLKPMVTPKTFDTAREYIELLLRHDVKEKLVASLNPLDCVEISAVRPTGGEESRYLQIRFNRVMRAGKVTHLLVTANDITRQVRLERELKDSERRVQDQMSMMVFILQADPKMLQDFLTGAIDGLNQINEDLRTSNPVSGITTPQLDEILRCAHRLKGDAAGLQLDAVTNSLHGFETLVQELKAKTLRKGEDLLPVTVRVKSLYAEIGAIQEVIARISQVRGVVSVEPPRPLRDAGLDLNPQVRQWSGFAQQLAQRYDKKIELIYQGVAPEVLAPPLREAVNTMVNQFVRNALVHGVEPPAERKKRGKPEVGHLSIYLSDQGDGTLELSFRDDGGGIDPERIRDSAIRSGRLTADAAKILTPRQLTLLIFEAGLSTQEHASEDAGRGVGLDAVKGLVARMGGRIRIGSTRGEYCHFRVQLPLQAASAAAVPGNEPAREAA